MASQTPQICASRVFCFNQDYPRTVIRMDAETMMRIQTMTKTENLIQPINALQERCIGREIPQQIMMMTDNDASEDFNDDNDAYQDFEDMCPRLFGNPPTTTKRMS